MNLLKLEPAAVVVVWTGADLFIPFLYCCAHLLSCYPTISCSEGLRTIEFVLRLVGIRTKNMRFLFWATVIGICFAWPIQGWFKCRLFFTMASFLEAFPLYRKDSLVMLDTNDQDLKVTWKKYFLFLLSFCISVFSHKNVFLLNILTIVSFHFTLFSAYFFVTLQFLCF